MKVMAIFGFLLLFLFSSCENNGEYTLVWEDDFNYVGLPDPARWSYDTIGNSYGWGNNEKQFYTHSRKENVWVEDGILTITALKEKHSDDEYTSTRLISLGKGDWKYGRIEVRASLPEGRGLWPAIWMLPSETKYGQWPASGEIDIMEHVGYNPDSVFATVHTKSFNHINNTQVGKSVYLPDCQEEYHVYILEWTADDIKVFVDDINYFTFTKEPGWGYEEWPFDEKFHLIMNLAVGGNWGGKLGIDDSVFPASMKIDYVKVYEINI